jgi:very-short-patch-repair endonuclease
VPYVNGFEIDLMVRRGRTLVNIEVDGNYHNEPAKRIADAQRDAFLRDKMKRIEFEIVRVPSNCSKSELFAKLDGLFPLEPHS